MARDLLFILSMGRLRSQGRDEPPKLDRLAPDVGKIGHSVHPYRDRREGLIERRRALASELEASERVVRRRERIEAHLHVVDEELRERHPRGVERIVARSPCRMRWEKMAGTTVSRRCSRCKGEVFDPALMTAAEIETLLARAERDPVVQLRRRRDGKVTTAQCPPDSASRLLRGLKSGLLLVAGAGVGVAACGVFGGSVDGEVAPPPHFRADRSESAFANAATTSETPPPPPPTESEEDDHHVPLSPSTCPGASILAKDAVRRIAPRVWEVERAFVNQELARQPATTRGSSRPRPIPYVEDGQVVGVKLYGVRRGSTLFRLGIRNGDAVLAANDYSLASADEALQAYRRIRTTDTLYLRLERRGVERVHVYRLVD